MDPGLLPDLANAKPVHSFASSYINFSLHYIIHCERMGLLASFQVISLIQIYPPSKPASISEEHSLVIWIAGAVKQFYIYVALPFPKG